MKETLRDAGLLGMRVALATMMIVGHGWPKLATFAERATRFADPLGVGPKTSLILAIGAEVGCSLAVALGLFTRAALMPLAFTMAMAAFVIHGDDPWQKKEMALLYLVPFLALLFTGAGRFSVDGLLAARKERGWQ